MPKVEHLNLFFQQRLGTCKFRGQFRVDAESIVVATLASLVREGKVQVATLRAALDKYALHDIMAADPGNTEGSG